MAITALALLLTIDDRYPGAIADGRQMAWTAIAMSETGEIGQARGRDFTWARPHGDAVSRYGMAMSLAQVPAAWLAPRVEATLGPGTSQPLFLIAPLFCVCIAAAAAGWIVLLLGSGAGAIVAAVVLTALGSPLGSYASLDLSEPLQAASLSVTLGCAVAATRANVLGTPARLYAFAAGVAAGIAVLTKSSLWLAVPFALLPMLIHAVATRSAVERSVDDGWTRGAGRRVGVSGGDAVRQPVRVLPWRGIHALLR